MHIACPSAVRPLSVCPSVRLSARRPEPVRGSEYEGAGWLPDSVGCRNAGPKGDETCRGCIEGC